MPRRTRSWSSRSSEVAISDAGAALDRRVGRSRSIFVLICRAVLDLATEMPRNVSAESDVKPAKPDGKPDIAPFRRRQRRGDPHRQDANTHPPDHRPGEHLA